MNIILDTVYVRRDDNGQPLNATSANLVRVNRISAPSPYMGARITYRSVDSDELWLNTTVSEEEFRAMFSSVPATHPAYLR